MRHLITIATCLLLALSFGCDDKSAEKTEPAETTGGAETAPGKALEEAQEAADDIEEQAKERQPSFGGTTGGAE